MFVGHARVYVLKTDIVQIRILKLWVERKIRLKVGGNRIGTHKIKRFENSANVISADFVGNPNPG